MWGVGRERNRYSPTMAPKRYLRRLEAMFRAQEFLFPPVEQVLQSFYSQKYPTIAPRLSDIVPHYFTQADHDDDRRHPSHRVWLWRNQERPQRDSCRTYTTARDITGAGAGQRYFRVSLPPLLVPVRRASVLPACGSSVTAVRSCRLANRHQQRELSATATVFPNNGDAGAVTRARKIGAKFKDSKAARR